MACHPHLPMWICPWLNVSPKSIPGRWLYPFTTSRALYFWSESSAFLLTLKIYLQPTEFLLELGGTRTQAPFLINALNSSDMAERHSRCNRACATVVGSGTSRKRMFSDMVYSFRFVDVSFRTSDHVMSILQWSGRSVVLCWRRRITVCHRRAWIRG